MQFIKNICNTHKNAPENLLEILHDIQKIHRYIPNAAFKLIANQLNLSRAEVYGVVSFYHDFRQEAPANTIVKICRSEACQSMGARGLKSDLEAPLADNASVAVEDIYCLGNCALAPAIMIDGRVYGRASAQMVLKLTRDNTDA